MDDFDWVRSFATSSYGSVRQHITTSEPRMLPTPASRGSFPSFVCHVSNLESKLRSFSPIVLDSSSDIQTTGKILGQGKTFMVKHALWTRNPKEPPVDVALKEIVSVMDSSENIPSTVSSSSHTIQGDWKDILFEIRVLLHEPIRYHPNIVRLLGIQWGLSPISESTYPVLLMEYASLGTFRTLQSSHGTLSFQLKQKLCYDVGRGLSALHACGIVHGDMKHENVLIFHNKNPAEGFTLTAKLADFGGTVMDMTPDEFHKMETWTWPFQAPEVTSDKRLTRSELKLTDVYSFGLLVWRAVEDGEGFVTLSGAAQTASDEDKRGLIELKASDAFTKIAIGKVNEYMQTQEGSQDFLDLFSYVMFHTVRLQPEDRNLVKALAALRGISPGHVYKYMSFIQGKNNELAAQKARQAPGSHGITRDSLRYFLGRSGNDVDLQDNLPGFRPSLDYPDRENFLFEPEKLKRILTWEQQQQMLEEMKKSSAKTGISSGSSTLLDLKKTVAAYYVFQCYLLEFGTLFDAKEAVRWLTEASSDDDSHEDADYLSQAWLWRVSRALEVEADISTDRLEALLRLSIIRGHRTSLQDTLELALTSTGSEQQRWTSIFQQSRLILLRQMGAVGIGYFYSSFLTAPFDTLNLTDLNQLDAFILAALGNDYGACLKKQSYWTTLNDEKKKERTAFDRIYINRRGHGLLHYAASTGALNALRHMIMKYECDINLPNQHVDETPLLCACESGNLDCALYLLDNGADPNGHWCGQEGPLHWLSSFLPTDMDLIATKLVKAGADLELRSGGMRHDVRGIRADWEHTFEIRTTPLGRAVLMNNLDAVKVLLKLGSNPLTKAANKHRGQTEGMKNMTQTVDVTSPFELAAILTYPEILAALIQHIDCGKPPEIILLNEHEALDLAHGKTITETDLSSLQSRLVRCGSRYKQNLKATLMILYARAYPFVGMPSSEVQKKRSRVLCTEVGLNNIDIVKCLLELGYDVNGTQDFLPIVKAVELNHEELFDLLKQHGAELSVTRMTPNGIISLLHVCASRPRQSRPGRSIADALIKAGVSVESIDKRTRPPLATAILHQNFDVAAALVENGADVDALYPIPGSLTDPVPRTISVLVEVLSTHTNRTLSSLRFLFGKHPGSPSRRPAFHIDAQDKLSILHLLAGSPNFTPIAQITPKILNLCLETYHEAELINYRHPLLGSALCYAAANGHKAMVERLIMHGADESVGAGPVMRDSVEILVRGKKSYTPLWAAILKLDTELRRGIALGGEGNEEWILADGITSLVKCVELLRVKNVDDIAKDAEQKLRARKKGLEESARLWKAERRRKKEGQLCKPVADLSILSESASESDENQIKEICVGPEEAWREHALLSLMGTGKQV